LLGWALIKAGRFAEGVAALERAAALAPGRTIFLGQLGQAYAMTGGTGKSRDILLQLSDRATRERVPPYHFAYIHTGLGQDAAVDWLGAATKRMAASASNRFVRRCCITVKALLRKCLVSCSVDWRPVDR
jgi:hypothetical protein